MCKITTYGWSCGEPLDDGIDRCPAAVDGRDPYRCPSLEEEEVVYPGCGGNCDYLGTPSSSSVSDEDYEDYDDEEEEEEEGEGEVKRDDDVPVSPDETETGS